MARPLGGRTPTPSAAAIAAAQSGSAEAARAARAAQNSLKRATLAIQAQQASQQAAREAARAALNAMPSGIPHGLKPGGLQVAPGATVGSDLWQGANLPTEFTDGDRTKVTVEQTRQKAILTWQTFNISEKTNLTYDQNGNRDWVALNRVLDNTAPSKILGNMKADGQVYVINRNGIIFGGTSQVNVGALTASALNISNEKFLGNFISTNWDTEGPTFAVEPDLVAGAVKVEAGAQIETANEGRVVLLGGHVENAGTIKTPGGQTLLGAGQQAYLMASSNTDMRGLRIELGEGGLAINRGIIEAEYGNITLAGRDVTIGAGSVLRSNTSVTANGSITLQARDDARRDTNESGSFLGWLAARPGELTIEQGALLEILPDFFDTQTVAATELLAPSIIELYGKSIRIGRDATLIASGGDINATAITNPIESAASDDSQIYVESGAILDVSGTRGVQLAMERNFIEVELRGNELRDNPLLKNSFLYGKKVWIDIRDTGKFDDPLMADIEWFEGEPGVWYGSSLFDASGWIGLIQRGVGELTSKGGTINLTARGDVVMREGSLLNVSGGTLEFASGYGRVTYLSTGSGKVSIGNANSGIAYTGFAGGFTRNHERWNVSETWTSPLSRNRFFEQGYTEGQAAGTINIVAPRIALDGDLLAVVEAGRRQLSGDRAPVGGALVIGNAGAALDPLGFYDYGTGTILVQNKTAPLPTNYSSNELLPDGFTTTVSADKLEQGGFGKLEIYANKSVQIAESTDLDLGARGGLTLASNNISVDGAVHAAGGDIRLIGNRTFQNTVSPQIALGSGAVLDVVGQWTNAFVDGTLPGIVDGGTVSVLTQEVTVGSNVQVSTGWYYQPGLITVAAGATIDVSGGAAVGFDGTISALGDAGAIVIGASSVDLSADAQLRGYAFATPFEAGRGGSLTLVGAGSTVSEGHLFNQAFFRSGGFADYFIDGIDSLTVDAGAQIVLAPQNRLLDGNAVTLGSGTALTDLGTLAVLPEGTRKSSSIALRAGRSLYTPTGAVSAVTGFVHLGEGSLIDAGIGGAVDLAAPERVVVAGTVSAAGGEISARINHGAATEFGNQRAIWLTETGRLLAQGAVLPSANPYGLKTGEVLTGGTVTLDASGIGYVVTEAGSLIDVSGGLAEVDVPKYANPSLHAEHGSAPPVRRETIASAAGSIVLSMRDGGYLDGDLRAAAQASSATDGNVHIWLGNTLQGNTANHQRTILVGQSHDQQRPANLFLNSDGTISTFFGPTATRPKGDVYVSAGAIMESGAGSLDLRAQSTIAFQGDVDLNLRTSINLTATTIRIDSVTGSTSPVVHLSAAHVSIGENRAWRLAVAAPVASAGAGKLVVEVEKLISFGGRTVLSGIDEATFVSGEDIRFEGSLQQGPLFDLQGNPILNAEGFQQTGYSPAGTLTAAGDITFGARQLYPGTGVRFTVETTGTDAVVSILPGDASAVVPYSVAGNLTIKASSIVHQGVLRAPLGMITLDAGETGTVTLAPGSVIDVSVHGRILPFGTIVNGDWYANYGTVQTTAAATTSTDVLSGVESPPAKKVTLSGQLIDVQSGSVVDLSGGGDVTAYEFVPGTGGSRNILSGAGVFAVIPGAQPVAAPGSTTGANGVAVGSSVYLSGIPGLADGYYTLLPAEYALMPGAFRVSVAGSANDRPAGLIGTRADGSYLVSGWQGSSLDRSRDARTSMFLVMPGDVTRRYSEFNEVRGKDFFPSLAEENDHVVPPLVADAGQLVLNAISALNLNGRFNLSASEGGRGGLVDIASSSIALVGEGEGPVAGYALTIDGKALSAMGAQSLLLGGTRQSGVNGDTLNAVATNMLIANDETSALVGQEVLLLTKSTIDGNGGVAGTGSIVVESGAVIRAEGIYMGAARPFLIGTAGDASAGTGMGALLAVSNAPGDLIVQRVDIAGPGSNMAGSIEVRTGATLIAGGSILFDATANSVIDPSATIRARSLEIASSTISFGDAPAGTTGFVANANTLAALASAQRLVLRGYNGIDFHANGNFDLRDPATGLSTVGELVLDGSALNQKSGNTITVGAQQLTLRNTGGNAPSSDPASTTGSLVLTADRLTIADGESAIRGFSHVTMNAAEVSFTGEGGLTAGGTAATDLRVETPFITAANAAFQSLTATGALNVVAGNRTALADREDRVGTGAQLTLGGNTVSVATEIRLPAGVLTLDAGNDLTVASGAKLDVSGRDQAFFDQTRTLPAGDITLISQSGNVVVQSGALLDLTDTKEGGKLTVTVPEGSFTIAGQAKGGRFVLDAGSLPSFGAMQAVLNDGGFLVSRAIRLRTGDALIDGVTKTRDFKLTVDDGKITVTGTIDASGATGGAITLAAADDIILEPGSVLTVKGENFDGSGKGGSVSLSAGTHRLDADENDITNYDATVDIRAGALIDLGVANAAAGQQVISLDEVGSSIALPAANTLGFPDGTGNSMIVSSVAGTITFADGTTAPLAADTPVSLPEGAIIRLSGAGTVRVASGAGKVAIVLPTSGAFSTEGATSLTSVPVTLNAPGSTINLAGGTPVILPNGTPGDDIISTDADSVTITTVSNGTSVKMTAGTSSLKLSAGSSDVIVSGSSGAALKIGDTTTVNAENNTVITLSRGGSSLSGSGIITFTEGFDATLGKLTLGGWVQITPPAGMVGGTVAVGTGTTIIMPFGTPTARTQFPDGTPAGTTLTGTRAGTIYAADGVTVIGTFAANAAFTVPPGAIVQFSQASAQLRVAGGASGLPVVLDNTLYTGIGYYQFNNAVTPIEAPNITIQSLVAGTRLNSASGVNSITSLELTGNRSVAVSVNAGSKTVTDVLVSNFGRMGMQIGQGDLFTLGGSGVFDVELAAGARYQVDNAQLGRLAAGTVLSFNEAGTLSFASGGGGAIPVLLPAAARFGATGSSLLDLGGGLAGTLHLRAPQITGGTDLGIKPINGIVVGAAQIIAEGYKVYDLTGSSGEITTAVPDQVRNDAASFTGYTTQIKDRLLANNPGLRSVLAVTPGAEIINANADAPGSVSAIVNPNGTLGLPLSATVTLPTGLNGSLVIPSDVILDVVVPSDGARVELSSNYTGVPAGAAIRFPDGTPSGVQLSFTGTGTVFHPNGTTERITTQSARYTLQPGSVVVMSTPGGVSRVIGTVPVIAVLSAGTYNLRGVNVSGLPAGTTLTAHTAGSLSIVGDTAPLPVLLSSGATYNIDGVEFTPPSGDLRLATSWDLSDFRFGPEKVPGVLTLRAVGNVVFDASLSDGFTGGVTGTGLIDDRSWSYNIVAGADFGAGDPLSVRPQFQLVAGKGDVIIQPNSANGTVVRTGTGEISIAAGRDIQFRSVVTATEIWYSRLYTAGRPANIQPAGGAFSILADGRRAYDGGLFTLAYGGGDLSLSAQRDIVGAQDSGTTFSRQNFSDWLLTQGETDSNSGLFTAQPSWGVNYGLFREGTATLGGGNVSVDAGRDLLGLNLAASNGGVYVGASPDTATLQLLGGGDLAVTTGRDALGNQIYVARGTGDLNIGRNLGSLRGQDWSSGVINRLIDHHTRLAIGDAVMDVVTRGDAIVGSVFNPTLNYKLDASPLPRGVSSYLSTYTDRSAVSVHAISGDIALSTDGLDTSGRWIDLPFGPRVYENFTSYLYPGSVEAVSFSGNMALGRMFLAPARDGDLSLLSAGSIHLNLPGTNNAMQNIVMSDADPSRLLTPTKDLAVLARTVLQFVPGAYPAYDHSLGHSASLYRAEDTDPVRIYAVSGDIVGTPFEARWQVGANVVMPKPAQIRAGRDIIDLAFVGQNFTEDQTTSIIAGRDFRQDGIINLVGQGWPDGGGVWIGGPGRLEMITGRHLDLGKSNGIQSVGNQLNVFLPESKSADIVLAVGTGAAGPDYVGFAQAYLAPGALSGRHSYTQDMLAFMRERTGNQSLDATQAWTLFEAMLDSERTTFIRKIFYKELIRTGTEGQASENYNAGYDAIASLFPEGKGYSGNLSLSYSQIKSVYDGGIDILVPGGGINGGVAVVGPEISKTASWAWTDSQFNPIKTVYPQKTADQLGIVAMRRGDINIMLDQDFIVNQSRVFAMGGDMLIWSSFGDINAGRGAKTAVLAPPPRLVFDPATGASTLEFTGAASGSGIATLITESGQEPGNMWLFAPGGVVDTGDAGVRVSGNLVIGAQAIRGTDNLQVSGLSIGVPTNTTDTGALMMASQTAAATQNAQAPQTAANEQPSIIIVEVLGFGGSGGEPASQEDLRRRQNGTIEQRTQNPYNAYQVLGAGEMTVEEARQVITERRHTSGR